jgi:hypothetical protein
MLGRDGATVQEIPNLLMGALARISKWKWQGSFAKRNRLLGQGKPFGHYTLSAIPTEVPLDLHMKGESPKHEFRMTLSQKMTSANLKELRALKSVLEETSERLLRGELRGTILGPTDFRGDRPVIGSYEASP